MELIPHSAKRVKIDFTSRKIKWSTYDLNTCQQNNSQNMVVDYVSALGRNNNAFS